MKYFLYKVDTNFFETPFNKGFQRVLLIEWEWKKKTTRVVNVIAEQFVSKFYVPLLTSTFAIALFVELIPVAQISLS